MSSLRCRNKRELAARMAAERDQKRFASVDEPVARIPQLKNAETLEFLTTDMTPPRGFSRLRLFGRPARRDCTVI